MAVLVDLQDVSVRRPDRPLFEGLSVTVSDGDRLGVVGINGTGKSTLLRVMAGTQEPEAGTVRWGRGTRIGFLDQRPELPAGTVRGAVGAGWEAEAALERLGMGAAVDRATDELSGGQAKRVALARLLAHPSDLLILDEPTNHLDLGGITWLEERLAASGGGLVLVSHDRHLLDRITTRMLELDRGAAYVHDGGYAGYLEARAEREVRAVDAESTRRNLARRELAWLRRGAPARTRKPQARIDSARRIIEGGPQATARAGELQLALGTPRLGDKVIELHDAGFHYPGGPPILSGVDVNLDPRERLGVVGSNGMGKSTLLELLAGRREPTEGRVERGSTVRVGYYDQQGVTLDGSARVRDLVAGTTRVPGAPEDLRLMEQFWFGGELQWARAGTLSGGERRRLQLLLVLVERPNVLLLDEPTNDLDLDTLRSLEGFLEDWPGALVAVSHDRAFLDRAVEHIVAVEAGGRVAEVAGGVAAWVAQFAGASTRQIKAAPVARPPHPAPKSPGSRERSKSTLGHHLRETERELARLTRQRDRLATDLAETHDHVELARVGQALAAVQADLDQAEERWLTLAEEAESAR